MGKLTTHVLDTMNGLPCRRHGRGAVPAWSASGATPLVPLRLNADGRADAPLLADDAFKPGRYRLVFSVAEYFRDAAPRCPSRRSSPRCRWSSASPTPARTTTCRCSSSPWSYATYRGSYGPPRSAFGASPQGAEPGHGRSSGPFVPGEGPGTCARRGLQGHTSGPAEPDPRWPLGYAVRAWRVSRGSVEELKWTPPTCSTGPTCCCAGCT